MFEQLHKREQLCDERKHVPFKDMIYLEKSYLNTLSLDLFTFIHLGGAYMASGPSLWESINFHQVGDIGGKKYLWQPNIFWYVVFEQKPNPLLQKGFQYFWNSFSE